MAESGVVLRQNGREFDIVTDYYAFARREPTKRAPVPVQRTQVFSNTFESLAENILSSHTGQIVVVAHGNPRWGLIMPFGADSDVASGYCIPKLVTLVDKLQEGAEPSDAEVAWYASDFHCSIATVRNVAQTCLRIRKETATATSIHVRGCDIGADVSHLKAIQALLKPAVVSAPVCPMFYIPVRPNRPPSLSAWAKRYAPTGRRRMFERAGQSSLLLDVDYQGTFTGAHSALEANGDLSAWANVFYETRSSSVTTSFPVAGLWPNDASKGYVLAHESAAYAGLLSAVRV
jgi:hypothetical protein